MLLGIQGAFTEYELAMITERMQESIIQKAARGELYEAFPPGCICRHALLADDAIAMTLNRTNVRTASGTTWTAEAVASFRTQHRIPEFTRETKEKNGWMTKAEAATWLDLSPMSMTRLVQAGIIPAEQPQKGMPTFIRQADLSLKRVQCAVAEIKQSGNRPLSHDPNQLKLFENHDF